MTDYEAAKARARASTAQTLSRLASKERAMQAVIRKQKIRLAKLTAVRQAKINAVRQFYKAKLADAHSAARSDRAMVRTLRTLLCRIGDELAVTAGRLRRNGRYPKSFVEKNTP
jgi:multidrug resistance efflux pump